jgi:hypothetical protein
MKCAESAESDAARYLVVTLAVVVLSPSVL